MKKILLFPCIIFSIASCTDAIKAKHNAFGEDFNIKLINCDGSISHEWNSSGEVQNSESSDGYYFMDKATGKLVEVSGDLIITQL